MQTGIDTDQNTQHAQEKERNRGVTLKSSCHES